MPGSVRVLLVDDDFELRYVIADALRYIGWEVRGAADGADALGTLRQWTPDVVLLDLKLPVMDGFDFCAEAERQHVLTGIPIIVTSASRNVLRDAQKLGAAALAKPFDLDELIGTIQELVEPGSASRLAVNFWSPR